MRVALVGCSKSKLLRAAPAADLYTGPLFKAAKRYAEATCDHWRILSAKHGALNPFAMTEPYNLTLGKLSRAERAAWAERVRLGLAAFDSDTIFVVLAGSQYLRPLLDSGLKLEDPLARMGIGRRLAWLKQEADAATPSDPARELAEDILDWDSQFGGPPDAECLMAGEDMARWVALARKVVGK
jgi:hypothetical protein